MDFLYNVWYYMVSLCGSRHYLLAQYTDKVYCYITNIFRRKEHETVLHLACAFAVCHDGVRCAG